MNGHGSTNGLGLANMRQSEAYYPNHTTEAGEPSTSAAAPLTNGYAQYVFSISRCLFIRVFSVFWAYPLSRP